MYDGQFGVFASQVVKGAYCAYKKGKASSSEHIREQEHESDNDALEIMRHNAAAMGVDGGRNVVPAAKPLKASPAKSRAGGSAASASGGNGAIAELGDLSGDEVSDGGVSTTPSKGSTLALSAACLHKCQRRGTSTDTAADREERESQLDEGGPTFQGSRQKQRWPQLPKGDLGIVELGRRTQADVERDYTAHNLWHGKVRKRDYEGTLTRISARAAKCADVKTLDEGKVVAEQLFALAVRLEALQALILVLRTEPWVFIDEGLQPDQLALILLFPAALVSTIMTQTAWLLQGSREVTRIAAVFKLARCLKSDEHVP